MSKTLNFLTPFVALSLALTVIAVEPDPAIAASASTSAQWTMGGHDLRNDSWQPTASIGPSNVARLITKWVFTAGGDVSAQPAVANGAVFFPDWAGNFYAINAQTGALLWSHQVSDWTGVSGDYSRVAPVFDRGLLIFGDRAGSLATYSNGTLSGAGARVIAVNALTGNLQWVTQVDSFPGAEITGGAVVFNGVVYQGISSFEEALASNPAYPCCSFRGSVVALNERTGRQIWRSFDIPPNPSNPGGYSGGAIWSTKPVPDPKRSLLYVTTGNNYTVPASVSACIAQATAEGLSDDVCDSVDGYSNDYFDSIIALDLRTGALKWGFRAEGYDASTDACDSVPPGVTWCPSPLGPDYDFGGGPNLFTTTINQQQQDVVGAGQKSGIYWALNPDTGSPLWNTLAGPPSPLGGVEWGTATDGRAIYVPTSNYDETPYFLQPSGVSANGGSWAALDPATGAFLWQVAAPGTCTGADGAIGGCMALGAPSVANGIVYAGSMDENANDPTMFALDAKTGAIFWSFAPGSSVLGAPAIVGNSLYWGAGYYGNGVGTGNNKLFAFTLSPSAS